MDLIIRNKVIITPMMTILKTLQRELDNGKLKDIGQQNKQNIPVTCPVHKSGCESHPSCQVFADPDDEYTQYGTVHCFTCGYARTLPQFIADCFDEDDEEFGNEWLLNRCETAFISEVNYLPPIVLEKPKPKEVEVLDESILKEFEYYHDYMWYRKLSREVVDTFEVGFDPLNNMITFPVRDDLGRLRFITKRSVVTKFFQIPENVEKPVYLLYYIKKHNIKRVAVVESQINALVAWSYGFAAVALFGTGTAYQLELLKKSGITDFVLMFDGDEAGRKGAMRFKEHMSKDRFITDIVMPPGKDVADCSYSEFWDLISRNINNYIV